MAQIDEIKKQLRGEDYYTLAHRANTRIDRLIKGGHTDTAAYEYAMDAIRMLGREGKKSFPMGKLKNTEMARAKNMVIEFLAKKSSVAGVVKKAKAKAKKTVGEFLDDEQMSMYFDMWRNADIRKHLERFSSQTETKEMNRWDVIKEIEDSGLSKDEVLQVFEKASKLSENDKQYKEIVKFILENKLFDMGGDLEDLEPLF